MKIEIWDNRQLQAYLDEKKYPTVTKLNRDVRFKGFDLFGPSFFYHRSDTENRGGNHLTRYPEDRHVVALSDSELVGLFSFMYGKASYDFWHYYPRMLDVREDNRNKKVATFLVRRLKEPCFLHGQVLMIQDSHYTSDGRNYLRKVIDRELSDVPFKVVDGWFTKLELYDSLAK
ncbi:hypothetical protein KA107_01710 [Candidatus Pacearchaeota archaeon]|nr:hypothetical protein [Candidatus Pacearchaeota archaeon]